MFYREEIKLAEVKNRNEIEEKYKWCLEDIFSSEKEWENAAGEVVRQAESLSGMTGKVTDSAENLFSVLSALDEIGECIPDAYSDMPMSEELVLRDSINGFIRDLPTRTRVIFLRRYFYLCSISDIAEGLEMSESNVKVTLSRTRAKFKAYLEKEGIVI